MPSPAEPRVYDRRLLEGRVVMVTGASGGIGDTIVRMLDDAGARLVCVAGRNRERAEEIAASLTHEALATACDVRAEAEVQRVVDETLERFGRLDVVVNNAGIYIEATTGETDFELWQRNLDVNLTSTYLFCRLATPALRASGRGAIVNITSRLGYTGSVRAAAYAATKAGQSGLTRSLAKELAPDVRVNAVAPGPIATPMTDVYSGDPAWVRRKTKELVMGRLGTPWEVATAVVFLASDASSYFTGQTLHPNGGGYMQ
jgi:3-oxoacyl-[acyl-carrier protein] reductase